MITTFGNYKIDTKNGIRRNKIFILTFILPVVVVLFLSILLEEKSNAEFGI
jgi:hypothetical protein